MSAQYVHEGCKEKKLLRNKIQKDTDDTKRKMDICIDDNIYQILYMIRSLKGKSELKVYIKWKLQAKCTEWEPSPRCTNKGKH